ncbi:MAG: ABC transporter permease, partial [Candidatus Competibacteraceae bacterium]|jgi:putative ABC transport system permease protein|nr:ABC transporter permease [Candidatus Competibacteraceae bacterium]
VLLGVVLLYALLIIVRPLVETHTGLFIAIEMLSARDMTILGLIVAIGFLIGIIPAIRAYRYSLADGMTLRL